MASKRQLVPQHEFGFTSEAFNLAPETQQAPKVDAPVILAEMTPEERERVREKAKSEQPVLMTCTNQKEPTNHIYCGRGFTGRHQCSCGAEFVQPDTSPGLAAGSYWSKPMAKALATFQK